MKYFDFSVQSRDVDVYFSITKMLMQDKKFPSSFYHCSGFRNFLASIGLFFDYNSPNGRLILYDIRQCEDADIRSLQYKILSSMAPHVKDGSFIVFGADDDSNYIYKWTVNDGDLIETKWKKVPVE